MKRKPQEPELLSRRRGRPRQFHACDQALQLWLRGRSIRQIAAALGTSRMTVQRALPQRA